jgi:hypothetical protein
MLKFILRTAVWRFDSDIHTITIQQKYTLFNFTFFDLQSIGSRWCILWQRKHDQKNNKKEEKWNSNARVRESLSGNLWFGSFFDTSVSNTALLYICKTPNVSKPNYGHVQCLETTW